jgi:glyoxylase-like metal-dependent hydrolase (beta-lactamase superfamily II)
MEITSNVHLIPGVIANPYLLVEPEGLTLIDTGIPGSHKKILGYMKELGFEPQALKRILITHADFDHVGGLAALKAASGARVYAHSIEAVGIAEGHSTRELKPRNALMKFLYRSLAGMFKPKPVKVDETLKDGQVLPVLGGLRVLETFGHTPGHLSFFLPSAGVLFTGDSIVSEKTGLRGSTGANNWDQPKSDASVKKQAELGAKIVCPGHGEVVRDAAGKFPRI